jgi:HTH-type transcriptional regulator, global nitrogen regulator NrpRI
MKKILFSILNLLEKAGKPLTSGEIVRLLNLNGIDLSERSVRNHLLTLDVQGYTENHSKKGREITEKGKWELQQGFATERVGFILNRINNLSFLTDFNAYSGTGTVVINTTLVGEDSLEEAATILNLVLNSPYAMSDRLIVKSAGERLGDMTVPEGSVAIGTICSITLNGVFLKEGIPVSSRFGGIVSIAENEVEGFVSLITYEGSSVAPLELFMKSRMTDVLGVLRRGTGKLLGSFREIPEASVSQARNINDKLKAHGFSGVILFGQPNQALLGIPVTTGKAGMVVLGGLNPIAALEEARISSQSKAMAALTDYSAMRPAGAYRFSNLAKTWALPQFFEHLANRKGHKDYDYWSVFEPLKQTTL